eukprot:1138580-Pelagomonas_calceolata.AAC.2
MFPKLSKDAAIRFRPSRNAVGNWNQQFGHPGPDPDSSHCSQHQLTCMSLNFTYSELVAGAVNISPVLTMQTRQRLCMPCIHTKGGGAPPQTQHRTRVSPISPGSCHAHLSRASIPRPWGVKQCHMLCRGHLNPATSCDKDQSRQLAKVQQSVTG